MSHPHEYPRLRPVELLPGFTKEGTVLLRDPSGLAAGVLAVTPPVLTLLARMDGKHRRLELQAAFARQFGEILLSEELDALLARLEESGFLEGESFERYYAGLVQEYLRAPYRPLRDRNGLGAPVDSLGGFLNAILDDDRTANDARPATDNGRLVGLIAPHLDYPRGRPCYAASYRLLRHGPCPERVVVLGTNHFGRAASVVATAKPFETPFGIVPNDPEFLERLQQACGSSLLHAEFDHAREHSVELQVIWLHHLLGDRFRVVPFLCPDPCGPTGTAPADGRGVDLRHFAQTLGALLRDDPTPTLLVAGADLSHVGTYFADRHRLDDTYLAQVAASDHAALQHVDANAPEAYREHMAATGNPTRVCSVGCIYALLTALGPDVGAHRLAYHQAVIPEVDNAVTCAAYAFYR